MVIENKTFIFLYPQEDIVDFEIEQSSCFYERGKRSKYLIEKYFPRINAVGTDEEKRAIQLEARNELKRLFAPVYSSKLNSCIHHRYRRKGFNIVYVLLDDTEISPLVRVYPTDRVIHAGMDAKTHRTEGNDGNYPYPDSDYILDQLLPVDSLVVTGFHLWDCVQRVAERAYQRGIDTIVDEDLTEQFPGIFLTNPSFRVKQPNSFDPSRFGADYLLEYNQAREGRPWMKQRIL